MGVGTGQITGIKAVAGEGSQVRRQLPYSARRHPQQPPPASSLLSSV